MVHFGAGPQHSALCSWGSTGAAKNKHGLLLLGTHRSLSLRDLNRLGVTSKTMQVFLGCELVVT